MKAEEAAALLAGDDLAAAIRARLGHLGGLPPAARVNNGLETQRHRQTLLPHILAGRQSADELRLYICGGS